MTFKGPIYDCHVNLWDENHYEDLYFQQMGRVRDGDMQVKTDADSLYETMQKVETAIIFSPKYGDSVGVEGSNNAVARAVAKYPDKFIGFSYVDPRNPDCLDLLKHSIQDLGLNGLKYGPIYNGVPLSDERLAPIFSYCEKEDVPVTLHMGTTYVRNAPVELGRPTYVEPIASKYPDLKLVLAHLGHPWIGECIAVVRKQPNVYAEISGLFYRPWQFYNSLVLCQEYRMVDKLFFGTDYPFSAVDEAVQGLKHVNQFVSGTCLPLVSNENIDAILYSNPMEHWWHDGPQS